MDEKRRLTAAERETIIRFDGESDIANVYTCDRGWITHCKKIANKYPDDVTVVDDDSDWGCYEIDVPKKWIAKPKPPKKMNRTYTESEKAEMVARMQKGRKAKNG